MKLIELRANKASFRTVRFKPRGISIIAAIKETEDAKLTYNSVGKSLTIVLIHFCLGSECPKEFKTKLNDWVFYLDFQIKGKLYTATRAVNNPQEIDLNGGQYSLKSFKDQLEGLLFKIKENAKFISFRSLMPRFIRYGKDAYIENDRYIKESPIARLCNNAFLLGLDTDLIIKKDEVRKQDQSLSFQRKELETSELKALFGTGTKSRGDIQIVDLEASIKKYKADIDAFVIAADYDLIKKEADALSYQLKEQRNKATLIINAIHNIEKSLNIQPDINRAQIANLYQEAQIELAEMVLRRLDELETFNAKLLLNRSTKLKEEKKAFEKQLKIINETITNLGHQEDQKLQYLSSTGALDDYTKLNQMLTDKEKELYTLMQYQNIVKQNQLAVDENRKEYIEDDIATGQYLEEFIEQKKCNIILFKSFVEKFYSEKESGISIENNTGRNATRYDITTKVQDDGGMGVNSVKIFCYDWTILKAQHNHHMEMLFHDSKITADMDTRQVKTMIETANQECIDNDFQYIISLNQNTIDNLQLEMEETQHKEKILDNTILTLSDKSAEGKLLGIQIDLNYEL